MNFLNFHNFLKHKSVNNENVFQEVFISMMPDAELRKSTSCSITYHNQSKFNKAKKNQPMEPN